MALGKMSKIMIFALVVNSLVAFAGAEGIGLGEDVNPASASDRMNEFEDQATNITKSVGEEESGFTVLDFFNPMGGGVWNMFGLILGFFADPILFAFALPMPLNLIMGSVMMALEATIFITIIRGVAA